MVVAGDRFWSDYRTEAELRVEETTGRFGIAVRQRNDRCYYFVGIDRGQAVIIRVQHEVEFRVPGEAKLAAKEMAVKEGDSLIIRVTVEGQNLQAEIGEIRLEAKDDTYREGRVALLADVPTRFDRLRVFGSRTEQKRVSETRRQWKRKSETLSRQQPTPKLWRLSKPAVRTDRNVRFGDLDGDGELDLLLGQIFHHGPTDSNSELGCMTAIDLQGKILWQLGVPDRWGNHLTNDTPFRFTISITTARTK